MTDIETMRLTDAELPSCARRAAKSPIAVP